MALTLPKLKLHNKILLALILGALFGAAFNVDKHKLQLEYVRDGVSETVLLEHWERFEFLDPTGSGRAFGSEDQSAILSYFRNLDRSRRAGLSVRVEFSGSVDAVREFGSVRTVNKVKTIATLIKPVGTIFIRLLMFVAIPLVLSSLIVGAASLGDIRKVGRIGAKTLFFYSVTIVSAITLGLVLVNWIQPGTRLSADAHDRLMVEFQGNIQQKIEQGASFDITDTIIRVVATNPIKAMADGEMLQIIFFALIVGVSLTLIRPEKAAPVVGFFDGFSDVMIRMVDLIMKIAPYGVFALIAGTVGEFGFDILGTLGWYAITLVLALTIHQFVTLGVLVKVFSGMHPVRFFRGIKDVMLIGFSSSSSAATLAVNMEACEQKLGVPKEITSFVLPLGATVNMDGTSMYQAVAAVFIAQVYGIDLSLTGQLTILLTAVLASIGTAPVPGVGIVMLIIVLRSVNVPEEGIALILGIDRLMDMCRTVPNVSGDAAVAVIMAKQEGVLAPQSIIIPDEFSAA
ncbi:MAG: dicarboxylate/amino acid:cation symporter [Ignavibacteria bacterium]|nr:dicarboxylate/amino acid:cation symporter [Ignavibacteria bacterium]